LSSLLSDYIHLNPIRAGLVGLEEKLFSYRWSSYPWYAARAGRPGWFEPARVLGDLGWEDNKQGRRAYCERMRERAVEERTAKENPSHDELRRGWCLGSAGFGERMIGFLERKEMGSQRRGEIDASLRRDHGQEQAARLLQSGLKWCGLRTEELAKLKKNDERKVAIAGVIRRQTTVANKWIADALHLGHVSRVSRCWAQRSTLAADLEQALNGK
jgi:hypothetical protein